LLAEARRRWLETVASAVRTIQPARELDANKGKSMKENENKIAFICFHGLFGNGTFQWVTADSNKKISSLSEVALQVVRKPHFLFESHRRAACCKDAKVALRE